MVCAKPATANGQKLTKVHERKGHISGTNDEMKSRLFRNSHSFISVYESRSKSPIINILYYFSI